MFSSSPLLQLSFLSLLAITAQARQITVANLCGAPVWAAYNGKSSEQITVNGKAGVGMWKQASGQEDVLEVPETWETGRIWPATGCDASGANCMVGGCGTGKCNGKTAGHTGATLAEFTIDPKYETYDISIVDGYNVPIAIIPTGGTSGDCKKVTCGAETDLLSVCDPSLAYPHGSDTVWSCMSPCAAKVQFADSAVMPFDMMTAPVCCPENTPEACPTSTIPFYDVYKPICNDAFLYAPDMNGNVVCVGPEYRIEFCPGGKGLGANPEGNSPVAQCAGGGKEIVGGGGAGMNDDGGGSTSGIPAGAGQGCAAGDSGVNGGSSSGSGTGSGTGNGSDTGSGSGSDSVGAVSSGTKAGGTKAAPASGVAASAPAAGSAGVASGDAASGGLAANEAGYWGSTANSGVGTSVQSGVTGSATAAKPISTASKAATSAATSVAAPAATAATIACHGRGCRHGGGGGRRPPRNRREECKRRLDDEKRGEDEEQDDHGNE